MTEDHINFIAMAGTVIIVFAIAIASSDQAFARLVLGALWIVQTLGG